MLAKHAIFQLIYLPNRETGQRPARLKPSVPPPVPLLAPAPRRIFIGETAPLAPGGPQPVAVKYCPYDRRNVDTEHSWNLTVLILLLIFLTLIGLIYMAVKWKERCPQCKTPEEYLLPPMGYPAAVGPGYGQYTAPQYAAPYAQPAAYSQTQSYPCSQCGATLTWYAQYNRWYCSHEGRWL